MARVPGQSNTTWSFDCGAVTNDLPELRPKDRNEDNQKQPLGGSLFGSTPSELQPLVPLQVAVTKAAMVSNTSTDTATTEYKKSYDPQAEQLPLPRQSAQLNELLKTLTSAENSISEVMKSRRELIDGLEKLLTTNRSELSKEETIASEIAERKAQTEVKKREIEDALGYTMDNAADIVRPDVEALTPPPVEAITPVGSPKPKPSQATHGPFMDEPEEPLPDEYTLSYVDQPDDGSAFPDFSNLSPGGDNDFDFGANESAAKRLKTTHEQDDYSQFVGGDLDDDVSALLASQGN
jgi:regulator of Ty1 transposition protein 103